MRASGRRGKRKQLIQTTFFWRTGELARAYFRSQNEKKDAPLNRKSASVLLAHL
jgi:hypothetical protein